jgi:two-component system NtrC family sensor kinase
MTQSSRSPSPRQFDEVGEVQLRAILDTIPARVAFIDRQRRHRYVNHEYIMLVGRAESEILGRTVAEVLGDEAFEHLRPFGERALAGETVRCEGWLNYPRVGERYAQRIYAPYLTPGDTIDGYFVFVRDLTDVKRGERALAERLEALRASEALSAAITASALDCIIVFDEGGRVVEFNPAAEQTFGYRRTDAVGRMISELVAPPASRDGEPAGLRHILETSLPAVLGQRIEVDAMRSDGSILPIELAIAEVRLRDRRLFTAYLRNLTEVKKAAAEIERQREALHQGEKLRALGSLLAGVAHELNNPLTVVIGNAVLLREHAVDGAAADALAARASKILTAAERCARIVRTFLAMARQRTPERRWCDPGAIVSDAIDLLAYALRTGGIEVEAEIPDNLPPVWVDEDQLHQALVNLLVNAQHALATTPRPRRIVVALAPDRPRERLTMRVADNGTGIPDDIRARIFDPFFTTKPVGMGTGMGLALSRGIVESHGGALTLDAPGAAGASFTLELPLVCPVPVKHAPPAREREARATGTAMHNALIVDDEAEIAEVLAQILSRDGFDCDIATDARAAKSLAAARDYDAILCDLRMPELDGPAFFEWLGLERAQLCSRTVFVTGDTLGQAAGAFVGSSGRPVIEKPFVPDDIRRVVASLPTRCSRVAENADDAVPAAGAV